jgi:hypothetical protein
MPTFRLEDEQGRWLTDMRLNAPAWKPGDLIPRGRDTLESSRVRASVSAFECSRGLATLTTLVR